MIKIFRCAFAVDALKGLAYSLMPGILYFLFN